MTGDAVALAAARWVELAGILGLAGVVTIRNVNRFPPVMRWARPPMHHALAVALAGGLATLAVGGVQAAVVARVVAEALALVLCLTVGRGTLVAGTAAVLLVPLSSHALTVNPAIPQYLVDVVHVVTAGQWAGGIAVLAFLRPPDGWRGEEGRELLRRFGGVALVAFAAVALTGLVQAAEQLGDVSELWKSAYGVVLAAKSAGVLAMLAMSAVTWRRGVPLARAETAVALAVLAASALLVAFPNTPAQA